jgi:ribosomal protein L21|uniref:Large ribosomal subunit protein bL21c n=1 Tax=Microchloropsis salina TaxID=2511165 RepID=T1RI88_9STRA|nr:ribosomal protein L21 [Microchloropsis salina]AGI99162.1 ribosomal protein L21 [Microchloropsis salina]AHX25457.1 50S ribosomal protein L21 [Microchloropsis salina]
MTNIYSIIESFGRQFWVEPDKFQDFYNFKLTKSSKNIVKTSSRNFKASYTHQPEKAKIVLFDRVMFYSNDNNVYLGKPLLNDFRIEGSLLPGLRKKSKLVVFKMRAKKAYRRKIGHKVSSRRVRFDNVLRIMSSKNRYDLQVLVKSSKT